MSQPTPTNEQQSTPQSTQAQAPQAQSSSSSFLFNSNNNNNSNNNASSAPNLLASIKSSTSPTRISTNSSAHNMLSRSHASFANILSPQQRKISSMSITGPQQARRSLGDRRYSTTAVDHETDLVGPSNRQEVFTAPPPTTLPQQQQAPTPRAQPQSQPKIEAVQPSVSIAIPDTASSAKIAQLTKDVEFLRDCVQRLNSELARYQAQYPPLAKEEGEVAGADSTFLLPPWVFNSEIAAPLLVAYDSRIHQLERQIARYKETTESLEGEIKEVTNENEELHKKLKKALDTVVKRAESDYASGCGMMDTIFNNDEWQEMQERLELYMKENDLCRQQIQELENELERLREENRAIHNQNKHLSGTSERANQLLEHAKRKLINVEHEKDDLQRDLHATHIELDNMNKENNGLVLKVQELQRQLQESLESINAYKRLCDDVSNKCNIQKDQLYQSAAQISQKDNEIQACKEQIASLQREIEQLVNERAAMNKALAELEERLSTHQQSEFELYNKAKEVHGMLEVVKLERDQALAMEETKSKEVTRLTEKIKRMHKDHKEKQDEFTKHLEDKHKQQLLVLQEEIKHLQLNNTQLQTQLERAIRDKKTAESEAEKVIRSAEKDYMPPQSLVSELTQRLNSATSERDEIERMYESLRASNKRAQLQWEQEREQMNAQITENMRRIYKLEQEAEDHKEDRNRLMKELDAAQKSLQNLKFEKEEAMKRYNEAIADLNATSKQQLEEMQLKLHEALDKCQQAERALESTVAARDRQEAKLKEELRERVDQLQRTIDELKRENERLVQRNEEMNYKLGSLSKDRLEQTGLLEELEHNQKRYKALLEIANKRAEEAANQITSLLTKEAELLREKTEILYELERVKLEKERVQREKENAVKKLEELRIDYNNQLHSIMDANTNSRTMPMMMYGGGGGGGDIDAAGGSFDWKYLQQQQRKNAENDDVMDLDLDEGDHKLRMYKEELRERLRRAKEMEQKLKRKKMKKRSQLAHQQIMMLANRETVATKLGAATTTQ